MSHPSRDDAFVGAASAVIGGPVGEHGGPHPFWTALRVVLAATAVVFAIGLLVKTPCGAHDAWWHSPRQFANACYSDLPVSYVTDGGAERVLPLSTDHDRFPPNRQSVPTELVSYAASIGTQALAGWPDLEERSTRPVSVGLTDPVLQSEARVHTILASLLLLAAALMTAGLLVRTHASRPWDAMAFAASPLLALSGIIGWDLMTVVLAVGATWAWSRERTKLSGALAGAGIAMAFWPLVVVLAIVAVAVRVGRLPAAGEVVASALVTWVVINVPAFLLAPAAWLGYVETHLDAGPSNGSVWALLSQLGLSASPDLLTQVELWATVLLVAGVGALAVLGRRRPRVPQVAFCLAVGMFAVHREYAPQYALALLCLAVLARPVWRDLLIWQATEVFYFFAIWWHLGGYTAGGGEMDQVYVAAIAIRLAGQAFLAFMVVRDMLHPWFDPVRSDGLHDDPAGGLVDNLAR